MNTKTKICQISKRPFIVTEEESQICKQWGVEAPSTSPEERLKHLMAFRNFRHLHKRVCTATGEQILSMYDTSVAFPVYENGYWWSDNWSGLDYGIEYDPEQSFFEQYKRLSLTVPRFATSVIGCEDCDYENMAFESKGCYLVFGSVRNEDCLYGHIVWDSKDCYDCSYAFRCERSSNSTDIVDCYRVHHSLDATNCRDSYFLSNCRNCHDCFGGVNLIGESYMFFGEQCSPEEYKKRLKVVLPLTNESVENGKLWLSQMHKSSTVPYQFGFANELVSGNHIYESQSLHNCFDAKKCERSINCYTAFGVEDSVGIVFTGAPARSCFNSLTLANAERVFCSHLVTGSSDVSYSEFCIGSQNLFGCIGLRSKSHCILNKEYSEKDYVKITSHIIAKMKSAGEWGRFFPLELSPFTYEQSIVSDYFPLKVSSEIQKGESPPIKQEGEFYKEESLPVPDLSPNTRFIQRLRQRAPRILIEKNCAGCSQVVQTAHASSFARGIFCENCLLEQN